MIAQTLVEYGALHSLSAAFMNAYHRIEDFVTSINSNYWFLLGIFFIIMLIWTRRRAH
jgi:hypothetical protein